MEKLFRGLQAGFCHDLRPYRIISWMLCRRGSYTGLCTAVFARGSTCILRIPSHGNPLFHGILCAGSVSDGALCSYAQWTGKRETSPCGVGHDSHLPADPDSLRIPFPAGVRSAAGSIYLHFPAETVPSGLAFRTFCGNDSVLSDSDGVKESQH